MYKIDLHVHTKYSKDSNIEISAIIGAAKKAGLDGIAITDHNTIEGALKLKRLRTEFEVIVGEEIRTNVGEVVGYHMNSPVKSRILEEVIDELRSQGAEISLPHPFDILRKGILTNNTIKDEIIRRVDYIEVNGRAFPFFNSKAVGFSKKHRKKIIGGSDAHWLSDIGSVYTVAKSVNPLKPIRVVNNTSFLSSVYPHIRTAIFCRLNNLFVL